MMRLNSNDITKQKTKWDRKLCKQHFMFLFFLSLRYPQVPYRPLFLLAFFFETSSWIHVVVIDIMIFDDLV